MDSESSKGIALTLRPGVTLNSTFAGHYDLAVYLNMIMTYLAAITVAVNGWLKRLPFLVLFVMLLWLFMQAGSRVGLLGLVFSVCLVSFFYRRYLLGLGFILIIFSFIATSPQYISRFQSILKVFSAKTSQVVAAPVYASVAAPTPSPIATPSATPEALRAIQQDTSTSIRFDVEWPRAIRAFYKNPLLGTGYSSISLATDNDYLRALGETGLLGLLAFLSILFGILKALLSLVRKVSGSDKIIVVSSIGIFAAFLTTAIFIDVFESSKIAILFWAYMGLALSINSQKNV
jgi:O-antigen ligase